MINPKSRYSICFSRLILFSLLILAWIPPSLPAPCLATQEETQDAHLNKMVGKNKDGKTIYLHRAVPKELVNRWPAETEAGFQQRARRTISAQSTIKAGVNTYFENEKRSYGYLMAHVLSEKSDKVSAALKALQTQDHQHQEWHRETEGIDYYAAFTIKHQMRKYFYFGELLDPAYKKRMFQGARKWTAKDPMRRPHYAYTEPKPGWGPDAKNSWVDIRSTENLFLMRVTSVYLMAEETGNQETTADYKTKILRYAATLYRVGIGEWDSENYLGHSIGPLLNLYDFAKDLEVKRAAKACLDFYFIAGAIKYYRGGFNGPTKRDYNHAQPFGGSAANMLWLMYGGFDSQDKHWESDEVHLITSAYRAPLAAVAIANKQFNKPVEIYSSKPHYSATTGFDQESPPEYLETQFISDNYQMGSLAGGTRPGKQDVNGFKIIAGTADDGGVVIQGIPGKDPNYVGSPQYQEGKVDGENRVAQYQNLAIWLARKGDANWTWVIPNSFKYSVREGVTFLRGDKVFCALSPLGTSQLVLDRAAEQKLEGKKGRKFANHFVLSAKGENRKFCGVAIEMGDSARVSFGNFQSRVLKAEIDRSKIESGIATYRSLDGKWLGFHWNDQPHQLGVWKNGQRHDFKEHAKFLYRTASEDLIHAGWGSGEIGVSTSRGKFHCQVKPDGIVVFDSE